MMTKSEQIIAHIQNLIFYADKIAGKQFHLSDNSGKPLFEIKYQPKGGNHSLSLEDGYMAVYTFVLSDDSDDKWLKVGQVSKNSNQRYKYDHYKTDKGSTLAKSLIDDPNMVSKYPLDESTVGDWIKNNCDRYDVWIDSTRFSNPKIVLNFVEGLLQYNLNPRYEG